MRYFTFHIPHIKMEDLNIPELHIPAEEYSLTSYINDVLNSDVNIRQRETLEKWKSNWIPDYHVLPYALTKYPTLTRDDDVQAPFLLNAAVGVVDNHTVVLAVFIKENERNSNEEEQLDTEIQYRHLINDTHNEVGNMGDAASLVKKGLTIPNLGVLLAYSGKLGDTVRDTIEDFKRVRGFPVPTSPELVALKVVHAQPSSHTLIVGLDPYSMKPKLFVVDPCGRFGAFRTYSIGRNFKKRNDFLNGLEEVYLSKRKESIEKKDYMDGPVRLAIRALVEVGESGEKNIEVAVITKEHGLKRLKQVEIDAIIAEIEAEKAAAEKPSVDETEAEEPSLMILIRKFLDNAWARKLCF